jgi:hypothetical protein
MKARGGAQKGQKREACDGTIFQRHGYRDRDPDSARHRDFRNAISVAYRRVLLRLRQRRARFMGEGASAENPMRADSMTCRGPK